ncbi:hypothetical protein BG011_004012 [Mortierella polycephala]|uniref:Uncharacterized protein n=1 Tax=Mortierella polycephala TaxID=41804 RepID=A0A9P6U392_9FUNG|nr:hypothetical protein BG011_004012 [Mortierella polycephala]
MHPICINQRVQRQRKRSLYFVTSFRTRTIALSSKTQIDITTAAMRSCEVYSPKVAHKGRHAGASEVHYLGMSTDSTLLIRMRCVILQDTILYLEPRSNGQMLPDGLIEPFPDII